MPKRRVAARTRSRENPSSPDDARGHAAGTFTAPACSLRSTLNPTPQVDVWLWMEPVNGDPSQGPPQAATTIRKARSGSRAPLEQLSKEAMQFTGALVAGTKWNNKNYFAVRAQPPPSCVVACARVPRPACNTPSRAEPVLHHVAQPALSSLPTAPPHPAGARLQLLQGQGVARQAPGGRVRAARLSPTQVSPAQLWSAVHGLPQADQAAGGVARPVLCTRGPGRCAIRPAGLVSCSSTMHGRQAACPWARCTAPPPPVRWRPALRPVGPAAHGTSSVPAPVLSPDHSGQPHRCLSICCAWAHPQACHFSYGPGFSRRLDAGPNALHPSSPLLAAMLPHFVRPTSKAICPPEVILPPARWLGACLGGGGTGGFTCVCPASHKVSSCNSQLG
jgi:hypothetical protein